MKFKEGLETSNKKKLKKFLFFSIVLIVFMNLSLISAIVLSGKFGTATLNPGEKYTVNIPLIGYSNITTICGIASRQDSTKVQGINVTIKYYNTNTTIGSAITDSSGHYCINLPAVNKSNTKVDIYVGYDNNTYSLGNNEYDAYFDNYKNYSKGDGYAALTGAITNYDAGISNGRVDVNLQYWGTTHYTIFDYQRYYVSIDSSEVYSVPSGEFNVTWQIPSDAELGQYKYYIKTSFNGVEKAQSIYFNLAG